MRSDLKLIAERMLGGDHFKSEELISLMQRDDLELRGAAYQLLIADSNVVEGEVENEKKSSFMLRYLVDCMKLAGSGQSSIFFVPPHVAARGLVTLYKQGGCFAKQTIKNELEKLCLSTNVDLRNCVINGALEHLLEFPESEKDFESWSRNSQLDIALKMAKAWKSSSGAKTRSR